ncbi:Fumarate reductase iron-sulfur subunit [Planctomycetes bacterium Pla163]|uniref:succinate dehydrogenase n=1 Tax=Rohdeia mirabilis TaxID=2528008 RepID=A0A518D0J8_9BACT|nr:Fumarate reductase iron-sulfur subunit [Planctomycetes bacterium Pla163]
MSANEHDETIDLTLKVWRQRSGGAPGQFETHEMKGVSVHSSFLEMMDVLNATLVRAGKEPVVFDHDCREGICGSCSMVINGQAHGAEPETATCQLHMRKFRSGETVFVEPWRADSFPVIRDLMVDRSAFDRVMSAGGYVSANTGSPPDANATPISREDSDQAMDAAACIGCGACVAACPNSSAMLFVGAKVSHLARLPQGQPERERRVVAMVQAMDSEGFGNCTNHYECSKACPKGIGVDVIAQLNRDYIKATVVRSN